MAYAGLYNLEVLGLRFEPRQFGSRDCAHYSTSLSQPARAAITECQTGWLKPQTFISHSFGG